MEVGQLWQPNLQGGGQGQQQPVVRAESKLGKRSSVILNEESRIWQRHLISLWRERGKPSCLQERSWERMGAGRVEGGREGGQQQGNLLPKDSWEAPPCWLRCTESNVSRKVVHARTFPSNFPLSWLASPPLPRPPTASRCGAVS